MTENEISKILVDIFLRIHSTLGPGLLESVYEETICYELVNHSVPYTRQQRVSVMYGASKMILDSGRI